MKQENLIFIALLVAAAVVLGTTFGIVNSYLTVTKLKNEHKIPVQTQDKQSSDTTQDGKPDAETKNKTETEQNAVQSGSESGDSNTLTSSEVREINRMLAQLGYEQKDIVNSVRSYQSGKNIKATGQIDESTLEKIIRETTLQKAKALAY